MNKEKLIEIQSKYLKHKLDNGYVLVVNEAEYNELSDEIKKHKNVKVNKYYGNEWFTFEVN